MRKWLKKTWCELMHSARYARRETGACGEDHLYCGKCGVRY